MRRSSKVPPRTPREFGHIFRPAAAVTPEFTRVEVESFGDTAVEVGTFVVRNDAGAVVDRGKHIVVWKEQDGAWRLHWDCFNSDRPPPRQKSE